MSEAEQCCRCGGGRNPAWHAPSPLWNAVMRGGSIDGDPIYDDMVCATCFMILAEDAGIAAVWRVHALQVNTPLETETPTGRIWDDAQFLWIDKSRSSPMVEARDLKSPQSGFESQGRHQSKEPSQ